MPPTYAGRMVFGDAVRAADVAAAAVAAQWMATACDGAPGTVGSWVPATFQSYARIHAPEPGDDWWAEYRDLHATVAGVAGRHTSTPDSVWFAIWEGHGFANATPHIAWQAPLDGLPAFETFSLGSPFRRYVLLRGPVEAAAQLHDPGEPGSFRRPDLWWPDDRRWFIATDTDFWSLYVGGDEALIDELAASVPTVVERCGADTFVNPED